MNMKITDEGFTRCPVKIISEPKFSSQNVRDPGQNFRAGKLYTSLYLSNQYDLNYLYFFWLTGWFADTTKREYIQAWLSKYLAVITLPFETEKWK